MHSTSVVVCAAGALGISGKVVVGLVVEGVGNSKVDAGNSSSGLRGGMSSCRHMAVSRWAPTVPSAAVDAAATVPAAAAICSSTAATVSTAILSAIAAVATASTFLSSRIAQMGDRGAI